MPNVSINNSGKSNEVYYENGYILIYIGIDRVNINNQILYYGGISIQVNILSDTWDKIYERHRYLLADDITTKEFNSECSKMISDLIMEFSLEYYKHK